MNVNNRSLGAEQEVLEIPQAKSIYDTETMQLPRSVGYLIILIANEAHEDWSEGNISFSQTIIHILYQLT